MLDLFIFLTFLGLIIFPLGRLVFSIYFPQNHRVFLSPSLSFGLMILTIEVYLLYLVGLFAQTIPLIVIQSFVVIYFFFKQKIRLEIKNTSVDIVGFILILFTVYINFQLFSGFGLLKSSGLALYGAHFVDSTWHLSLIQALIRSFPPVNPLYSGTFINNYHYLSDLQIAFTHSITTISIDRLFFVYFSLLYLFLAVTTLISLVTSIIKSKFAAFTSILFVFWSSNWYYLATAFFPLAVNTPSVAWLEFFSSKVVNFPLLFSLSYLFVLMEILLTSHYFKSRGKLWPKLLLGLFSGFLIAFKSHIGLVWLGALLFVQFFKLFKKDFYWLPTIIVSFIIGTLLSFSISTAKSALELNPFWFIKVMLESPDHFNYPEWELQRQTLLSLSAYPGIVKLYLQGLGWFFLLNFGPFILGFGLSLRCWFKKTISDFELLLWGMFLAGFTLTMLFVYRPMAIVTIQFIYLSLISLAILTSVLLSKLYHVKKLSAIALGVLIWFSLSPGVTYTVNQYRQFAERFTYGLDFVDLLNRLSTLPHGVILADTSFLSGSALTGYTGQDLYLGDFQIIDSLAQNKSDRASQIPAALNCQIPDSVNYLLTLRTTPSRLSTCSKLIFQNASYLLYQKN